MALITLQEAKGYLRVDTADEDAMIGILLSSAGRLCADVARLTNEEWEAIDSNTDDASLLPVRETMKVVRSNSDYENTLNELTAKCINLLGGYQRQHEASPVLF